MLACTERAKLLRDWRDAVVILAHCIEEIETSNIDRFDERYRTSLMARLLAERAHANLTAHRTEHGC